MTYPISIKSLILAAGLGCAAVTAHAATVQYKLDAISDPRINSIGDFSLIFDDLDMDGLFSFDELVSFSGVAVINPDRFFATLVDVPTIAGFTDGTSDRWSFSAPDGSGSAGTTILDAFDYSLAPQPAAVPLPAGGVLLLTGLAGLAHLRRRRRA